MGKSQKKLADEAYMRSVEQLEGRAPVPPGVLPGQIDMLTGEIAGSAEKVEHYAHDPHGNEIACPVGDGSVMFLDHIRDHCPTCARVMTIASGWTPLHAEEGQDTKVMCGHCGQIAIVPANEWKTLRLALQRQYADVDRWTPPLKPEKKGRTRGAG